MASTFGGEREVQQSFVFSFDVDAGHQIGKIQRHGRLGFFEFLQLGDEWTHHDESVAIVFNQGRLELVRLQVADAQLHGFDQAFVSESQKIAAVFDREARRASGRY